VYNGRVMADGILFQSVILCAVFFLGTIIGSFLNVLVIRYKSGKSSVRSRSQCLACAAPLSWKDLFPIVSYLVLRGRCRYCSGHISVQYPLVEACTGFLFVYIYLFVSPHLLLGTSAFLFSILDVLILWGILGVLILIVVYDIRHMIIPDMFVIVFLGLSLAYLFVPVGYWGRSAVSFMELFAALFFAGLFVLMWFFSKGTWMGLGDAKLVFGMGLLLGWKGSVSALLLAFWTGAAWGLFVIAINVFFHRARLFKNGKRFTMKSEMPFGPFLVLGLMIVFFFHLDVFSLLAL